MRRFTVKVNGTSYDVEIEEVVGGASRTEEKAAAPSQPTHETARTESVPAGAEAVRAPLQAAVLRVNAKVGDRVSRGDCVCVLEAMKMEYEIASPADGVILSVDVAAGTSVEEGQLIFTLSK